MRLTNDKRRHILREEATKKYYDKLLAARNKFIQGVEGIVKKNSPKIPSRLEPYIKTTSSFTIKDMCTSKYPRNSLSKGYPRKGFSNHEVVLTTRVKDRLRKYKVLEKEEELFKRDLRAVLFSFSTVKKLCDHIPEFKKYFEGEGLMSTALVPVQQIKKVRESLVKEKKTIKKP